jgi:hydrogenase expression/formation protein HypC
MCLGVPGKIIEIYESDGLRWAGSTLAAPREACLAYVPEATVGDYTVIHVGFAISLLSEEEAQRDAGNVARDHRPGRRDRSRDGRRFPIPRRITP